MHCTVKLPSGQPGSIVKRQLESASSASWLVVGSLGLKAWLYIARCNREAHDLLKTRSTTLYTAPSTAQRNRRHQDHEVEHIVTETRQHCGDSTLVVASNGALSPRTRRCSTAIRSVLICYLHLNHVIWYNSIKVLSPCGGRAHGWFPVGVVFQSRRLHRSDSVSMSTRVLRSILHRQGTTYYRLSVPDFLSVFPNCGRELLNLDTLLACCRLVHAAMSPLLAHSAKRIYKKEESLLFAFHTVRMNFVYLEYK
jgi:hypothetical protein